MAGKAVTRRVELTQVNVQQQRWLFRSRTGREEQLESGLRDTLPPNGDTVQAGTEVHG